MTEQTNPNPQQIVVVGAQKSLGASILLTLFFGPLGLMYSTLTGGLIMLVLSVIIGIFTLGFGLIFTQIICVIWGIVAVNSHNSKMMGSVR